MSVEICAVTQLCGEQFSVAQVVVVVCTGVALERLEARLAQESGK